jgi:hypothetical protein
MLFRCTHRVGPNLIPGRYMEICSGQCTVDLQEVGGGRGDWMELAQDGDRWRALVGTVRNFRVP